MTFKKKLSALLAAGAIGLAGGTFGVAMPTAIAQADLVDASRQGSLTINKKDGDPTASGYETMKGLGGVTFNVERVEGIDLTTNAGWADLRNITATELNGHATTDAGSQVTNGDGVARFDLPVGVYRVTEVQKSGYSVAPPFLITLPFSNANGTWSYDQVVYPKNQTVMPDKKVNDTNATIGSNLAYTINAPVPADDLDRFNIVDTLIDNLALMDDPAATVVADGVALVPADYVITYDANTLRVNFNRSGLDKLQDARVNNADLEVVVEFQAQVVSIPTSGSITNTAVVELPNGGRIDTDADLSATNTLFGNLTINKTSSEAGNLAGAEFELYQCVQDAGKWTVQGDALNMATGATADTGDVARTITTVDTNTGDTEAVANGYGIPLLSNSGSAGSELNTYCVVETKAPDTYVRNPEPQPVSVDVDNRVLTAKVENHKDSILGQLPATGAWGIGLIFLIGLALLARGLYTSYRDSKATA